MDSSLLSLCNPKQPILLREGENPEISDSDKFQINDSFEISKHKLRISMIQTKEAVLYIFK